MEGGGRVESESVFEGFGLTVDPDAVPWLAVYRDPACGCHRCCS